MKNVLLKVIMMVCWGLPVSAQNLIPATSEDLSEFDRQISQTLGSSQVKGSAQGVRKGSGFGKAVAEEAKKLGSAVKASAGKAEKPQRPAKATEVQMTNDAKISSPSSLERGHSSNAPGKLKR